MTETRIPIAGFVIKADTGGGWATGEPYTYWDKRQEKDVEGLKEVKYYATISQAVQSLANRVLHKSAAQSLHEVKEILEDLRKEIAEGLKIEG